MVPSITHHGYERREVQSGSVSKTFAIHRLVMACFVGPCPKGFQVNHKDGNKRNNCLWNLEYVLPKENIKHSILALGKTRKGTTRRIMTHDEIREARRLRESGWTVGNISKRFGVAYSTISQMTSRNTWTRVSG
jgi:hypothetical protein